MTCHLLGKETFIWNENSESTSKNKKNEKVNRNTRSVANTYFICRLFFNMIMFAELRFLKSIKLRRCNFFYRSWQCSLNRALKVYIRSLGSCMIVSFHLCMQKIPHKALVMQGRKLQCKIVKEKSYFCFWSKSERRWPWFDKKEYVCEGNIFVQIFGLSGKRIWGQLALFSPLLMQK